MNAATVIQHVIDMLTTMQEPAVPFQSYKITDLLQDVKDDPAGFQTCIDELSAVRDWYSQNPDAPATNRTAYHSEEYKEGHD